MIKCISLIHRKPGMSHEEFCRYWKLRHGPVAAGLIPGLRKYVQNHPVKTPGTDYDYDGFTELWFDSLEAYEQFTAWRVTSDPKAKALSDDEDNFVDKTTTIRYIVEEHAVL